MRKLNLFFCLLTALMILSCSTSDENEDQPSTDQNGFEIENTFFSTSIAYINDENTDDDQPSDLAIILTNKDLLNNTNIESGLNYLYIDFSGVNFDAGSKTIRDYRITENASYNGSIIEDGNTILDDSFESGYNATASSLIINSVSSTSIDFDFSFTREDGEIISGGYSGAFTDLSN